MKTASAAATDSAITSLAGLRLTPPILPLGQGSRTLVAPLALLARLRPPGRNPVPVVVAEGAGQVLGEGVAIALAVGGAHEGGDHVEVPLGDVGGLAPEVGQA